MGRAALVRVAAGIDIEHRWSAEEARRVLDAWEASGESGVAFARRLGIQAQRLWFWSRRLSRRRGRGTRTAVARAATVPAEIATGAFVPVTVRGGVQREGAAIVVEVGPARVEVREVDAATAAWVALLVESLEQGRS